MALVNVYSINVDIKRRMTSVVPTFKQGDAAKLKFRVYDDGVLLPLTNDIYSEITFTLPNGETLLGYPELVNGELVYDFTGLEMVRPGKIITILSIMRNSTMVSVPPFNCFIFNSMRTETLSYIGILQDLIKETQDLELVIDSLVDNFKSFDYSPTVTYKFPNFVTYNGSTYLVLREVRGVTPTDDKINYRLIAQKGGGGGGGSVSVIDDLNSESTNSALSAKQGNVLNTSLTNHSKNDTSKKHIEVVSNVPSNLSESGIFIKVDGTQSDVPSMITVDTLNDRVDDINTELSEHIDQKGQPNGYASLDANGKIPSSQINIVGGGGLDGMVNVKDFGVIGDGVADDTVAIQRAFDSADEVYFPDGLYKITDTVVFSGMTSANDTGFGDNGRLGKRIEFSAKAKLVVFANVNAFKLLGSATTIENMYIQIAIENYTSTAFLVEAVGSHIESSQVNLINNLKMSQVWHARKGTGIELYTNDESYIYRNKFTNIDITDFYYGIRFNNNTYNGINANMFSGSIWACQQAMHIEGSGNIFAFNIQNTFADTDNPEMAVVYCNGEYNHFIGLMYDVGNPGLVKYAYEFGQWGEYNTISCYYPDDKIKNPLNKMNFLQKYSADLGGDTFRGDIEFTDNAGLVVKTPTGNDYKLGVRDDGKIFWQNKDNSAIIEPSEDSSLVVNVKSFGAKADGVTDDTEAIQNAIDSISDFGGVVFIPRGEYLHSTLYLNENNITLMGEGDVSYLINKFNTPSIVIGAEGRMIFNCNIKNINMDGNNGTTPTAHAIEFIGDNPARHVIEGVRINNFGGHGIYGGHDGHVNNVEITRCAIHGCGLDGINMQYGVGQINAVWIHHNDITRCRNGILFFGNNVVVENNTIQANRNYAISLSDDSLTTEKFCLGSAIKNNYTELNASDITENASIIGLFTGWDSENENTNKFLRNLIIEDNYFGEIGEKFRSLIYNKDLKSSAPSNKACVVTTRNNYVNMPLVSFNKSSAFGEGWIIDENYFQLIPPEMLNSLPEYVEVRGIISGERRLNSKLQELKDEILSEIPEGETGGEVVESVTPVLQNGYYDFVDGTEKIGINWYRTMYNVNELDKEFMLYNATHTGTVRLLFFGENSSYLGNTTLGVNSGTWQTIPNDCVSIGINFGLVGSEPSASFNVSGIEGFEIRIKRSRITNAILREMVYEQKAEIRDISRIVDNVPIGQRDDNLPYTLQTGYHYNIGNGVAFDTGTGWHTFVMAISSDVKKITLNHPNRHIVRIIMVSGATYTNDEIETNVPYTLVEGTTHFAINFPIIGSNPTVTSPRTVFNSLEEIQQATLSTPKDEHGTLLERVEYESERIDGLVRVNPSVAPVKVLFIGNSFSWDVTTYISEISKNVGVDSVYAVLYRGGESLQGHMTQVTDNANSYTYSKTTCINGVITPTTRNSTSAQYGIKDEDWDIVVLQQSSDLSGMYSTYQPYLGNLIDYVKSQATNPNVKIAFHMTWAYATTSTHAGFANYSNNQTTMYNGIVEAALNAMKDEDIDILIPSGTIIQNARTHSYLNGIQQQLTEDGYHLGIAGDFIGAIGLFRVIMAKRFNKDIFEHITYTPSDVPNTFSAKLIAYLGKVSVENAVLNPFKITEI